MFSFWHLVWFIVSIRVFASPGSANNHPNGEARYSCLGFYNGTMDHWIDFSYELKNTSIPMEFKKLSVRNHESELGCYHQPELNETSTKLFLRLNVGACGLSAEFNRTDVVLTMAKNPFLEQFSDIVFNFTCDFTDIRRQNATINGTQDNHVNVTGDRSLGWSDAGHEVVSMQVIDAKTDPTVHSTILEQCVLGSPIRLRVDLKKTVTAVGVRVLNCFAKPSPGATTMKVTLLDKSCGLEDEDLDNDMAGDDANARVGFQRSFDANVPTSEYWAYSPAFDCFRFSKQNNLYFHCEVTFCAAAGDPACDQNQCINTPVWEQAGRRRRRDIEYENEVIHKNGLKDSLDKNIIERTEKKMPKASASVNIKVADSNKDETKSKQTETGHCIDLTAFIIIVVTLGTGVFLVLTLACCVVMYSSSRRQQKKYNEKCYNQRPLQVHNYPVENMWYASP